MNAKEAREKSISVNVDRAKSNFVDLQKGINEAINSAINHGEFNMYYASTLDEHLEKLVVEYYSNLGYDVEYQRGDYASSYNQKDYIYVSW